MARKKQKWDVGDIFSIPLKNGEFSIGQIIGYEKDALNSVICAFYDIKEPSIEKVLQALNDTKLISIQFVTRDLLDIGEWSIIGHSNPIDFEKYIDLNAQRKKGFVGISIEGSGIMIHFLNAFFKLAPWDMMLDTEYFDKLLISKNKRPENVILSK